MVPPDKLPGPSRLVIQLQSLQGHYCLYLCISFCVLLISSAVSAAERDANICDTITTKSGDVVTLRDDVPTVMQEFEKVQTMKLKEGVITPVNEKKCALQICGWTALSTLPDNPSNGCLGSDSDLMDCEFFYANKTLDDKYNHLYNASTISCGCDTKKAGCKNKCNDKRLSIHWEDENDCARFYREYDCHDCYFQPIKLKVGEEIVTDHSHHFNSIIVRDQCVVSQNASALKKYCRFQHITGLFTYGDNYNSSTVKSAFQLDPEVFTCECPRDNESTTPPNRDSPYASNDGFKIALGLVSVAFISAAGTVVGMLFYRRRFQDRKESSTSFTSNITQLTDVSEDPLDFNQISRLESDPAFETSPDLFQLGQGIDEGNFGCVCVDNLKVAIKTLKGNIEDKLLSTESIEHEINIFSRLGVHKNVVRFLFHCVKDREKGEIYLITEYCQNGSLKDYLKKKIKVQVMYAIRNNLLNSMKVSDDGFREDAVIINIAEKTRSHDLQYQLDAETLFLFLKWSEEIASGMQFITSSNVVHLDLATRNVMIDHGLTAKIGDFGLSKKLYIRDYVSAGKDSFPLRWVALESLSDNKYSPKSDVWSYGVTVWEIFTLGDVPYGNMEIARIYKAVKKGEGLKRPEYAPDYVYSKLLECWKMKPNCRPTFQELREYFASKKDQIYKKKPSAASDNSPISQTHL